MQRTSERPYSVESMLRSHHAEGASRRGTVLPRRQFLSSAVLPVGAALLHANLPLATAQSSPQEVGARADGERKDQPVSEIPLDMRAELAGNVRADRRLSAKQLEILLKLSDCVIDKNRSRRIRAAEDLGLLGHKYGIPALLAVLRDETDGADVRAHCVYALSLILDKRAVYFMIEDVLGSDSADVVIDAHTWLAQMVKDGVELDLQWDLPRDLQPPLYDPSKESRAEYERRDRQWLIKRARFLQQEWRTWWKAHKDKPMELSRTVRGIH